MKDSGTSVNGNKAPLNGSGEKNSGPQGLRLGNLSLEQANRQLRGIEPFEIIEWVLRYSSKPILTTNFGPYSASLLHAVTKVKKDISVIWCDTGYNTPHTYRFARDIMERLSLNMESRKGGQEARVDVQTIGNLADGEDALRALGHPADEVAPDDEKEGEGDDPGEEGAEPRVLVVPFVIDASLVEETDQVGVVNANRHEGGAVVLPLFRHQGSDNHSG